MLNVSVNMKQGTYIITGEDGQQVVEMPMNGQYDKETMESIISQIKRPKVQILKERRNLIDAGLYSAISEFDKRNGTNYADKYIDIIIPVDVPSRKKIAKGFSDNKINIQYNLSLFGAKGMNLGERLKAIRFALSQKKNGIDVKLFNNSKNKNKQLMIDAPSARIIDENIPDMEALEKAREKARIEQGLDTKKPVTQAPEVQPLDVQEQSTQGPTVGASNEFVPTSPSIEELFGLNIPKTTVETNAVPPIIEGPTKPEIEEIPQVSVAANIPPILPEMQVEEGINPITSRTIPEIPSTSLEQEPPKVPETKIEPEKPKIEQPKILPPKQAPKSKKAISRSKAIQASKKAQREASQMRNLYKDKIKAQQKRRAVAERLAAEGRKPKQVKTPTPGIVLPPPTLAEKKKPESPTTVLRSTGKTVGMKDRVTRFTRLIKDKSESIRNKKHIPTLTQTNKRKIRNAVTLVTTIALATAAGAIVMRSATDTLREYSSIQNEPQAPQIIETIGQQTHNKGTIEDRFIIDGKQEQTPTETPSEQAPVVDNKEEMSEKEEYLSSIKVGATININEGKYFETPEGTGNYGRFENYKDGVKRISMIEIMTKDGYTIVKDSDVNLYELKQQYPDAKFSYHIVCENKDNSKTTLGWLTEESRQQERTQVDQQSHQSHMDLRADDGER